MIRVIIAVTAAITIGLALGHAVTTTAANHAAMIEGAIYD
jgi:hypothetical protein